MKQIKNRINITQLLPTKQHIPIFVSAVLSSFLIGCASAQHREFAISNVIEKETLMIEKLKTERAQPDIVEALKKNRKLGEAEAHLILALDELARANEELQRVFLNDSNKGEKANGNK